MSKFQPGTVEKNLSTIASQPGIKDTPVRCRCIALISKILNVADNNYLMSSDVPQNIT